MNYEHIFYDENGAFIPLSDGKELSSMELDVLRKTYLEAERKYFLALLDNKDIKKLFYKYAELSPSELFKKAMEIYDMIENGKVETPEELEMMKQMSLEEADKYHISLLSKYEALMALLLAAAREKGRFREKIFHEVYDSSEEKSRSR